MPGGEEGSGGRTPALGSERGFRAGSGHRHGSAAERIARFCLLAGQRGEGLLLAPAPESSQGARSSALPRVLAAFGLGRYIKRFTAPNSPSGRTEMRLFSYFSPMSSVVRHYANLEIFTQLRSAGAARIATFGIRRRFIIHELQP